MLKSDAELAVQEATNCCGGKSYRFVHDRNVFASWFTHVDEHAQRERFWSKITPGDVVLDIGAGSGSYTLPALARGAAHVYAFSPHQYADDPSIDLLSLSLEANGWRERCTILPFGLWSEPGWLVVRANERPTWKATHAEGAIPVRALDAVADRIARPIAERLARLDWVKLDVEGAEAEVLRGGAATIARLRPRILVENHLFLDAEIEEKVTAVLAPLGYEPEDRLDTNIYVDGILSRTLSHVLWRPKTAPATIAGGH